MFHGIFKIFVCAKYTKIYMASPLRAFVHFDNKKSSGLKIMTRIWEILRAILTRFSATRAAQISDC